VNTTPTHTPSAPGIRPATRDDLPVLARLITIAFDEIPLTRWLVPDPIERAQVMPRYFTITLQHALDHGHIHTTTDLTAVAVWVPGGPDTPPIPDYDTLLEEACRPHTGRFHALDTAMNRHHPTLAHDHLAFLAVHPDTQSQGLGSTLLNHHHAHLDETGRGAYLEAASTRSRDLYTRHDYKPTRPPFTPATCTQGVLWPMWREPQHTPTDPDLGL
jgi:GNAT superfamily N-acetyltransferase